MPLLSSCIKTVTDRELPAPVEKLVVGAFLSPDDENIEVKIAKSFPPGSSTSGEDYYVKDADVVISNGEQEVTLNYYPMEQTYMTTTSDLPIIPGKTYFLNVTTPSGLKASSYTTVPKESVQNINISIDSSLIDSSAREPYYDVKVSIDWHSPEPTDHFKLRGDIASNYNSSYYYTSPSLFFGSHGSSLLVNDKQIANGKVGPFTSSFSKGIGESGKLIITLYTIDEHYYQYDEDLKNTFSGDPFSEPKNIHSNIEGGLGIFTSYRKHEFVKEW
ncbi:DUF4249 domain-containing protein [Cytophagaceae bacterium ABcell3]|nr:DUF4249 domain-containing protein [Cytophagaceae bacterium ABcell3]